MRRIACTRFQLGFSAGVDGSLACYERLTDQGLPHRTSRELKPSPPARRQMCDPSHIQLAAAGTRAFFAGSIRRAFAREAEANAFKDMFVQRRGAYGANMEAQALIEPVASRAGWVLIRSRQDWTAASELAWRRASRSPRLSRMHRRSRGKPGWSTSGHANFRTHYWRTRADRAGR